METLFYVYLNIHKSRDVNDVLITILIKLVKYNKNCIAILYQQI
jgi:hypothetical protein